MVITGFLGRSSKMFDCFDFVKDIGYICSDVKFSVTFAGEWPFLAVAVGKTFHVYSAEELKLTQIGAEHSGKVTQIAAAPGWVFTATQETLRSTNLTENEFVEAPIKNVSGIIPCGEFILVTTGSLIMALDSIDLTEAFRIETSRQITTILHPNGYQNKILVAYEDCGIDLWNIKNKSVVYSFRGWKSMVRRIVQSTVMDVMAFVLCNGSIVLHHCREDSTLFTLKHSVPVCDLAFRVDGPGQLVVGTEDGALYIWDLNTQSPMAMVQRCHDSPVSSVCCVNGTQYVITGGCDNCIRQWIFDDDTQDIVRLHRFRVGHPEPPVGVAFAEVNGIAQLITASGTDKIIAMNPAAETTSMLLSTAPLKKRYMVNRIKSIATTNAQRFCSVASQHDDGTLVFLWDVENSRFAKKAMTAMPKNGPRIENDQTISFADFHGDKSATCTCLTRCGNFGCVGTNRGSVEVFVTQSGRHKGSTEKEHEAPLVFVHVDAINTHVISGASDGSIFFHQFDSLQFVHAMDIPGPITSMAAHPNSQLLAIAAADKVIIIDCQSHMVAREFDVDAAHMTFSHDGKYLFVASETPFVHLFDMITANLIETVRLEKPITGLAAHPRGDLIATLHADEVATRLWSFKPERITTIASLERVHGTQKEGLAVFSDEPVNKIKSIINPPKDPLRFTKAKRNVPFFLTASTNIAALAAADKAAEDELAAMDRFIMPSTMFIKQLKDDAMKGDFTLSMRSLKLMNSEDINIEVSALDVTEEGDERLLFLQFIEFALQKKTDFEFIQSVLAVFLREFGVKILENPELKAKMNTIRDLQKAAIDFMERDLAHSMYLIQLINRTQ